MRGMCVYVRTACCACVRMHAWTPCECQRVHASLSFDRLLQLGWLALLQARNPDACTYSTAPRPERCMKGIALTPTESGPCSMHSMVIVNTEWERLLSWFMRVAPTLLFFLPTWSCMQRTGGVLELKYGMHAEMVNVGALPHFCTRTLACKLQLWLVCVTAAWQCCVWAYDAAELEGMQVSSTPRHCSLVCVICLAISASCSRPITHAPPSAVASKATQLHAAMCWPACGTAARSCTRMGTCCIPTLCWCSLMHAHGCCLPRSHAALPLAHHTLMRLTSSTFLISGTLLTTNALSPLT